MVDFKGQKINSQLMVDFVTNLIFQFILNLFLPKNFQNLDVDLHINFQSYVNYFVHLILKQ